MLETLVEGLEDEAMRPFVAMLLAQKFADMEEPRGG